jgi:hypothetical protein
MLAGSYAVAIAPRNCTGIKKIGKVPFIHNLKGSEPGTASDILDL